MIVKKAIIFRKFVFILISCFLLAKVQIHTTPSSSFHTKVSVLIEGKFGGEKNNFVLPFSLFKIRYTTYVFMGCFGICRIVVTSSPHTFKYGKKKKV